MPHPDVIATASWGVVVATATAAVAVVTLVLRELQRRRADLDQKVNDAVSAGIGRTLLEYREFEAHVRASLEATVRVATEIEHQLQERLQGSEERSARLEALLANAAEIVPRLEASRTVIPSMLLVEAAQAQSSDEALGYLSSLLDATDATGDTLETAGDLARERFGADALALALYERATQRNPSLVSARASEILLKTKGGQLSLEQGREAMSDLVKSNPHSRNALSEALNLYAAYYDYQGMLELVDELLALDAEKPLLWRNRAVALDNLGRKEDAETAFARSEELTEASGEDEERANTARPYALFLMRAGRLKDARRVIQGALVGDPGSTGLLRQLGEVWEKGGNEERAKSAYEAAVAAKPNPDEARLIQARVERLIARNRLNAAGLLESDAAG
jgi:tetratricopeptide (TPR) repeat protein